MKEKRDNISTLKTVATILVVLAHVTRMYTGYGAIKLQENSVLRYFTEFIYLFHMPLFMFLSGAIYGKCIKAGKYNNFKKFVQNKAKRLLIPYIIFGILYVTPVMFILKITSLSVPEYIIKGIFLNENSRHLWYLYVLFEMFVIIQLIKPLLQKNKIFKYVLFVISIAMVLFNNYMPLVLGINNVFKYFCYFVAGYIYADISRKLEEYMKKYWYISFAILFVMMLTDKFMKNRITLVICAFLGILLCLIVVGKFGVLFEKNEMFQKIKNTSMGIYLFHPMIIYVMFYLIKDKNFNEYLVSIIIFVVSTLMSYWLTKLARLLKMNIILGE